MSLCADESIIKLYILKRKEKITKRVNIRSRICTHEIYEQKTRDPNLFFFQIHRLIKEKKGLQCGTCALVVQLAMDFVLLSSSPTLIYRYWVCSLVDTIVIQKKKKSILIYIFKII